MQQETLGVGIVSFAHPHHAASYTHALTQIEHVRVAAMYDEDRARGAEYAARLSISDVYTTLGDLLDRADIQAVVVCSANDEHAQHVIAAAQAGKHVLCEKPIATRIDDAQRMIAACKQAGVQLHLAFPARFMPEVQHTKHAIDNHEIGSVFGMVGGNRGRPPLPPSYPAWITEATRSGGGAVIDHSVHVTDAMRYITGAEVATVSAEVGTLFHPDLAVDDCGLLLLTFRNGIAASVDPSWSIPHANPFHYDFYLRMVGTDGAIELDDTQQSLRVATNANAERGVIWESFGIDPDAALVRHFINCIRLGTTSPPGATGEDGLRALEIALAAYESARSGQPINLPFNTGVV